MKEEKKRTQVLEMMLSDGFVKTRQVTANVSEYGKGTSRLYYDEQRDVIIKTYDIRRINDILSHPKGWSIQRN